MLCYIALTPEYAQYFLRTLSFYREKPISLVGNILICNFMIVQSLIYLSDPLVWKEFLRAIKCKRREIRYSQAPLNQFLNSALNVELVYLILSGIHITLSNGRLDDDKRNYNIRIKEFPSKTRYIANKILMENKNQRWNVSA